VNLLWMFLEIAPFWRAIFFGGYCRVPLHSFQVGSKILRPRRGHLELARHDRLRPSAFPVVGEPAGVAGVCVVADRLQVSRSRARTLLRMQAA
jgi:hypothetical protein